PRAIHATLGRARRRDARSAASTHSDRFFAVANGRARMAMGRDSRTLRIRFGFGIGWCAARTEPGSGAQPSPVNDAGGIGRPDRHERRAHRELARLVVAKTPALVIARDD